jgi:acetylglutamate kinase
MNTKIVVIKYGGAAMQTPALMQTVAQDIVHVQRLGMHPVIVHGGGPAVSKICQKMGIVSTFVDGLRVTDRDTLAIAQMVLVGQINKEFVSQLHREGAAAVGLSGHDGLLILAAQMDMRLGFVGKIERVNAGILTTLIHAGFIPVIAPIATSQEAQSYNVNADSVAASIAMALHADHLIFLTDVAGVLQKSGTKIDSMSALEARAMLESGHVQGGMIPKIEGAFAAIQEGVSHVHILDGRVPHVLLLHFQNNDTKGTSIIYV